MVKIIFTAHARQQMQERNITEKRIISALDKSDKVISQSNFRKKAIKQFTRQKRKYLLIAVYEERYAARKVITAFVTSKIKKYPTR